MDLNSTEILRKSWFRRIVIKLHQAKDERSLDGLLADARQTKRNRSVYNVMYMICILFLFMHAESILLELLDTNIITKYAKGRHTLIG